MSEAKAKVEQKKKPCLRCGRHVDHESKFVRICDNCKTTASWRFGNDSYGLVVGKRRGMPGGLG